MKGLKKIALVTAIAAAPFAAQAELKALDDAAMGSVTGQAGVTIDLSANVSIAEIAYQDQGFLVIDGLTLGGAAPGTALDNIRLTVDVAGGTDPSADLGTLARGATYLAGAGFDVTGANEDAASLAVEDGDLVIGLRAQNSAEPVDFGLSIGAVSLAKSGGTIGDLANEATVGTTLVSDMNITGVLGPIDIIVQENSNTMNINAYFNANGAMTLPFMGTSLEFELHNRRGDAVIHASGLSFAHAQVDVSVKEGYFDDSGNVVGENGTGDALAVNVKDFSGDLDLTNITMGNGASIGSLYMTDLKVTANTVIYGH